MEEDFLLVGGGERVHFGEEGDGVVDERVELF